MSLKVADVSIDRTIPVMAAFGRLDAQGAQKLRGAIAARDFLPSRPVVLDLGGVVRATPAGMEAVDALGADLDSRGHPMILIAPFRCPEWNGFSQEGIGAPVVSRLDEAFALAADGSSI